MIKKLLLLVCVLAVLVAGIGWMGYRAQQEKMQAQLPIDAPFELHVEKGTWYSRFVDQLVELSLVEDPLWLKIEARLNPSITHIKAGEYRVEPGMTLRSLLERVVKGDTVSHQFTLVEGMTFRELHERLLADDRLKHQTTDLTEQQILERLGIEYKAAEGLFLAETYQFERGASDLSVLKRAHEDLNAILEAEWAERMPKLPYQSPYEALIMASIIEKETGVPSERNEIAGVFVRRLEKGMRLQTDPTVIYGMGDRYQGNITRADLKRHTPWNTYTIDGLPPTPIALVGREAIEAALHPAEGKALYFVARGDGSHQFSNTLREHNNAVRRYQLNRRADYRSSPNE